MTAPRDTPAWLALPAMRPAPPAPACRCCGAALHETVADLGVVPLAGCLVAPERAAAMEPFYPLRLLVCSECRLVQVAECGAPDAPCAADGPPPREAARHAEAMIAWLGLDAATPVMEVARRGPALRPVFARRGIPVLDPDPPAGAPAAARFGAAAARRLCAAGCAPVLLRAGDLLATSADPHDVAAGLRMLLAPGGVLTMELPYLPPLLRDRRLDAIHHGQVCHFSLTTAELVLAQHGLVPFDAEDLPGPGCALRIYLRHQEDRGKPVTEAVEALRRRETAAGLGGPEPYRAFAAAVPEAKCALLDFLVGLRRAGRRVAGYGTSPGGATLLAWCGVGPELLSCTVDAAPERQGRLLPGTRIPIRAPAAVLEERPDFLLVLSSDLAAEAMHGLAAIRDWGGRFALPVPALRIC